MAPSSASKSVTPAQLILNSLAFVACAQVIYRVSIEAYRIRLYAIEEFGRIIHEFDPYFNYRATEYLWENGWYKFSHWFDYKVWYPLGRPVGTTIYPGMQVTSVAIKKFILPDWSINDICCFVPAWFGVLATLSVGWLTYECVSGNDFQSIFASIPIVRDIYRILVLPLVNLGLKLLIRYTGSDWGLIPRKAPALTAVACATAAAAVMSVIPAHLMRSIGGGYDNESIAMTAMSLTYACWCRSLKPASSTVVNALWGVVAGVAYFNMVAAWGGYVFVLNLIGLHAGVLVLLGRYSERLHRAYTAFYLVGTFLAIRVPVVGYTPIKSLEQMGPMIGFVGLQLIETCEVLARRRRRMTVIQLWKLRLTVFLSAGAVALVVIGLLAPTGYFGPISSRVRGLFVKHTKTGNPLVDSVAEHQAASPQAYFHYLNVFLYVAPLGFVVTALFHVNDTSLFLLVYGMAAYFFSHKMVRLLLLTGPIASCFGGIVIGRIGCWMFASVAGEPIDVLSALSGESEKGTETSPGGENSESEAPASTTGKKKSKSKGKKGGKSQDSLPVKPAVDPTPVKTIRILVSAILLYQFLSRVTEFKDYAHQMARQMSNPSIVQKGRTKDGREVVIDDYRQAYLWLKDNTPEDARIMAWWDYGYQITGISNRTTIADGNTWNHEHIAFLGRTLTSPEKDAHRIIRHLADYVLVWAGGGGDDLAKSPHLRRIANSVYRGLCDEPTCRDFGFYQNGVPTESMEQSLLFKLVANKVKPEVEVDPHRFREVHRTKYGKVRIYKVLSVAKESKEWIEDPANRLCDAPGSWFCPGQYPPALEKILAEKKDFKQLEDFNVKGEDDSDYTKEYLENLNKQGKPQQMQPPKKEKKKPQKLSSEDIEIINANWENSEKTTLLWQLISDDNINQLKDLMTQSPEVIHLRSEDGRGPMWWAYEYGRSEIVALLKKYGVRDDREDSKGVKPTDLA